jgi:hypothetical protein
MSRPLASLAILLALLVLASCSSGPRPQSELSHAQALNDYEELRKWLSLHRDVESMSTTQATAALRSSRKSEKPDDVFYYALLNQRIDAYGNWTLARDKFRELSTTPGLTDQQRQLVLIFERYNQTRINWYMRRELVEHNNRVLKHENQALHGELATSQSERLLLQQKIQAITDLETAIIIREEQ